MEIFNKAGVKLQNNNVKGNNIYNSMVRRTNQFPSSPSSVSDHNCDGGSTTSETNSNVSQQQYQFCDHNECNNDYNDNPYNGYYDEHHSFGDDSYYGLLQPPLLPPSVFIHADNCSSNDNNDYLDNNLLDLLFSDDESD